MSPGAPTRDFDRFVLNFQQKRRFFKFGARNYIPLVFWLFWLWWILGKGWPRLMTMGSKTFLTPAKFLWLNGWIFGEFATPPKNPKLMERPDFSTKIPWYLGSNLTGLMLFWVKKCSKKVVMTKNLPFVDLKRRKRCSWTIKGCILKNWWKTKHKKLSIMWIKIILRILKIWKIWKITKKLAKKGWHRAKFGKLRPFLAYRSTYVELLTLCPPNKSGVQECTWALNSHL